MLTMYQNRGNPARGKAKKAGTEWREKAQILKKRLQSLLKQGKGMQTKEKP